jgi:hypothetical protein
MDACVFYCDYFHYQYKKGHISDKLTQVATLSLKKQNKKIFAADFANSREFLKVNPRKSVEFAAGV